MAAGAFEMIRGSTNSSIGKGNLDEFFMIFLKIKRMNNRGFQICKSILPSSFLFLYKKSQFLNSHHPPLSF